MVPGVYIVLAIIVGIIAAIVLAAFGYFSPGSDKPE
jgi:hypothetical protein